MMNPQRKRLLIGAAVGSLGISALLCWHPWDRDPIRYGNFDQIKPGMTLAEVSGLLGCPPDNYCSREVEFEREIEDAVEPPEFNTISTWQGNHGDIVVFLSDDNRVLAATRVPAEIVPYWVVFTRALGEKLIGR